MTTACRTYTTVGVPNGTVTTTTLTTATIRAAARADTAAEDQTTTQTSKSQITINGQTYNLTNR